MTYECAVCRSVNHAKCLHCRYCGTVPAMYSPWGIMVIDKPESIIPIVVAHGAIRQTSTRTIKRRLRTVKSDYYAEA